MHGFTLLELLVVVTIVAIISTVAVPRLHQSTSAAAFETSIRDLVTHLRDARRDAVRLRTRKILRLVSAGHSDSADTNDRIYRLPRGVEVSGAARPLNGAISENLKIEFFEDGSSSGGVIELRNGKRRRLVEVDWLTGRVILHE